MKLELQIATAIAKQPQITISDKWATTFRHWLISKGGRCEPTGDVLIKSKRVHFEKTAKRYAVNVSLQEVTA